MTLEIGTGSGFQSALLSRIVKQAYSIEIIEPLGKAVSQIFAPLGYGNVHTRVGDGYYGWPEVQGGFDIIIVTCAAQYAPPDLFKQMKPGGRLVIPIGQPFKRGQVLYVYTKDGEGKIHSKRDMGVFFIPMTGAIAKTPAPHGAPAATSQSDKPVGDVGRSSSVSSILGSASCVVQFCQPALRSASRAVSVLPNWPSEAWQWWNRSCGRLFDRPVIARSVATNNSW